MTELPDSERRAFLQAAALLPLTALGQSSAPQGTGSAVRVEHGADRFGEMRKIAGVNQIAYKVASRDTGGNLFLLEQTTVRRGGPPRHLHHSQDEWFYILEGEFIAEVGAERMRLKPGDSLLAPRKVPHTWAYAGEAPGRLLVAFLPAGQMEGFFHAIEGLPNIPQDAKLFSDHGMELVGPPISLG